MNRTNVPNLSSSKRAPRANQPVTERSAGLKGPTERKKSSFKQALESTDKAIKSSSRSCDNQDVRIHKPYLKCSISSESKFDENILANDSSESKIEILKAYAKGKSSLNFLSGSYSSSAMKMLLEKSQSGSGFGALSPRDAHPFFHSDNRLKADIVPIEMLTNSPCSYKKGMGGFHNFDDTSYSTNIDAPVTYKKVFCGIQAYGETGLPILEELVEAAFNACDIGHANREQNSHVWGAAVLTTSGQIYSACNVDSCTNPELSVSAEKTAVLKAVSDGITAFDALAIASDTNTKFPTPEGSNRQFLAEFGDFPVYLVNSDLLVKAVSTYQLFPMLNSPRKQLEVENTYSDDLALLDREQVQNWTEKMVILWLKYQVQLPEYGAMFIRARIDGNLLVKLTHDDLQDVLRIGRPIHRRRILVAIEKLKSQKISKVPNSSIQRSTGLSGTNSPNIGQKFPQKCAGNTEESSCDDLQNGQLLLKLRRAYGKYSTQRGELPAFKAKFAFAFLGHDVDSNVTAVQWCEDHEQNGSNILFTDFVLAYYAIFGRSMVSLKDKESSPLSRKNFKNSPSRKNDEEESFGLDHGCSDNNENNDNKEDCGDVKNKGMKLSSKESVQHLTSTKRLFDRFSKNSLITSAEAVQALMEAGVVAPRIVIAKYLRNRGFTGVRREIPFFEFMRALAALGGEIVSKKKIKAEVPYQAVKSTVRSSNTYPKTEGRARNEKQSSSSESAATDIESNLACGSGDVTQGKKKQLSNKKCEATFISEQFKNRAKKVSDAIVTTAPNPFISKIEYQIGDQVEANYKGRGKYFRGCISKKNIDGSYNIDYADGDYEANVSPRQLLLIKRANNARGEAKLEFGRKSPMYKNISIDTKFGSECKLSIIKNESLDDKNFCVGDRIEARYMEGSQYFPGIIVKVNSNETFSVEYESNEIESDVAKDMLRRPSIRPKFIEKDLMFMEGDEIEACSRSSTCYNRGKIKRKNKNGTYDVEFIDGSIGLSLETKMIRLLNGSPKKYVKFQEGDKIEAKLTSNGKFFPGKVMRIRNNGTFDIEYDDGRKEFNVSQNFIRAHSYVNTSPQKSKELIKIENNKLAFNSGDKVEVKFQGKSRYFPAIIKYQNRNGTYDVKFDDGDEEDNVPIDFIRFSTRILFEQGDQIEARYLGKTQFIPGFISRVNSNETYDIIFETGERESDVVAKFIRHPLVPKKVYTPRSRNTTFKEGEKIEVRHSSSARFFPGKIEYVNGDGTYDIDYDNGEKERNIEYHRIKYPEFDIQPTSTANLRAGIKVEVQYLGKSKYYPGVIRSIGSDGNYIVDYNDGEVEVGVKPQYVRVLARSPSAKVLRTTKLYQFGDKIEARYKGYSRYFPGRIQCVNDNGTYNIAYDGGEKELEVKEELIKSTSTNNVLTTFSVGEKIEARYRGGVKYYPGIIQTVNRDNTYDVFYSNGENELCMDTDQIRKIDSTVSVSETKPFKLGDRVEVRFKGQARYYPGKIAFANCDGTYDIDYDDGGIEKDVSSSLIKLIYLPQETSNAASFTIGDKVEARYKGRMRYYPGTIKYVNKDSSFDIIYDDGEEEENVPSDLIKVLESGISDQQHLFKIGNAVEARYLGQMKFTPGVITNINSDGTYNIKFDDGEVENNISANLIKPTNSILMQTFFNVGDKVEARYKGRQKYFLGRIKKVNVNNTFDIVYDDDDEELGVAANLIRLPEQLKKDIVEDLSVTTTITPFQVGEKVEARYKGKTRFYPGLISRVRYDGTYDVSYNDGEEEEGISAFLIKRLDSAVLNSPLKKSNSGLKLLASFTKGDRIEAMYKGSDHYVPGFIRCANLNGTYDVDYDNGDDGINIPSNFVRARALSPRKSPVLALKMGSKIEARFKGGTIYFPGTIAYANFDGTFDIDYNDGKKETDVAPELVRAVKSPRGSPPKYTAKEEILGNTMPLKQGDKVKAKYRGKDRYYPGKIRSVNRNGSYDIEYDDGDKETEVDISLILRVESNITTASPSKASVITNTNSFEVGNRVEARYGDGSRFYPGEIKCVNRDGTYDIEYDSGEHEFHVAVNLIQLLKKATGTGFDQNAPFKIGDKIEARFKGRSRYFPGHIKNINNNGSIDVDYDDGDFEAAVPQTLVKLFNADERKASPRNGLNTTLTRLAID